MIEVNNLEYQYPKKKRFSLSIERFFVESGEIFTLLGPNGAGKTTLIRIISGLILPRTGSVKICGLPFPQSERQARSCLGLVIGEERTFYYRLSGAQNLEFFGGLYGLKRSFLKTRIPELLELVGLGEDGKLQYMRYSSGMKKRLCLARALLHNPKVLLLDEPNSGIDPRSAKTIREIIFDLKKAGHTIMLTTHDMDEAERMSDRIGFLRDGKLIKVGDLSDFKKLINKRKLEIQFRGPFTPDDIPDIQQMVAQIRESSGGDQVTFKDGRLIIISNGNLQMNRVFEIISGTGYIIERSDTQDASLEEVFLVLSGS